MIIRIKSLKAHTILGVYEWEKKAPREVILHLALHYDGARASVSDNVADTIDYDVLSGSILAHVESRRYELIERMVSDVLDIIGQDERVTQAEVEIEKPGAIAAALSVSVQEGRVFTRG